MSAALTEMWRTVTRCTPSATSAGTVATASGARKSLFVPALAKLFVAVPMRGCSGAEVRVFSGNAAR